MKSNGCRDVQHTDLQIKAHKQEGTLVSKVHKQGALCTPSQASLHISGCTILVGYTDHLVVGRVAEYPLWQFDLQKNCPTNKMALLPNFSYSVHFNVHCSAHLEKPIAVH